MSNCGFLYILEIACSTNNNAFRACQAEQHTGLPTTPHNMDIFFTVALTT